MPPMYRPDFSHLSRQLAENTVRVVRLVDELCGSEEPGSAAAIDGDWQEVQRLSEYLAHCGQLYGHPKIAEQARQVCQDLKESATRPAAVEGLVRLIGMCGRAEKLQPGASKSQ